jgi:hypothetical protein
MFQLREAYVPPAPVMARLRPSARVGAARVGEDVPLKDASAISTKSEAADYMNLLQALRNSFSEDVDKNVVIEDPAKWHDESEANIKKAADIDGCEGILSCDPPVPYLDSEEPDKLTGAWRDQKGEARFGTWTAWSYRNKALHQLARARYLEDIWDRRGLTKATAPLDYAFDAEWNAWDDRRKMLVGQIESWSASDFSEIQRLDLDLQRLRRRYTELTGLEPSMAWPSKPPPGRDLYDLAKLALWVVGAGVAVYALSFFLAPAASVAPAAAAA